MTAARHRWVLWGWHKATTRTPIRLEVGTLAEVRREWRYREKHGDYWDELYVRKCVCSECTDLPASEYADRVAAQRGGGVVRMPTTINGVPVFPIRIASHRTSDYVKRLIEMADLGAALAERENAYGNAVRYLYCVHRFGGRSLFGPWIYLCPEALRSDVARIKGVTTVKRYEDDAEWYGAMSQERIPA